MKLALSAVVERARKFNSKNKVIFAAGDDLLFRGYVDRELLSELQKIYTRESGLTCSIGYGRTLREVYVAMKLAKAEPGKSGIVGIELADDSSLPEPNQTAAS